MRPTSHPKKTIRNIIYIEAISSSRSKQFLSVHLFQMATGHASFIVIVACRLCLASVPRLPVTGQSWKNQWFVQTPPATAPR